MKHYRVLVLAMSTLSDPLKVGALKNRYYYKCEENGNTQYKGNYHGIGQLEPIPQYIMEQYGDITHVIILTTNKTTDKLLSYDWEKINEQIALLEENGGQGDGAVIDLTEEEKENGLSAVEFFKKRMAAFCKKRGIHTPHFKVIDFSEEQPEAGLNGLMQSIRKLYQDYRNDNKNDTDDQNWQMFVDVHGGLRDASFVIFAMIHNLSAPDEQDLIGMGEKISAAIARLTDGKGTVPVTGVFTIYFDAAQNGGKSLIVDRTDFYNMFVRESLEAHMNYGQYAGIALKSDIDPESDDFRPYAFISYRRLDAPKERFAVLGILKKEGYRYWYDDGIELHEDWQGKLELANAKSAVFIALITKQYYKSYQCVKELRQALDEKRPGDILLISTDGTSLYPPFSDGKNGFTIPDQDGHTSISIRKDEIEGITKDNHLNLRDQMHHGVLDKMQFTDKLRRLCEKDNDFSRIKKAEQ